MKAGPFSLLLAPLRIPVFRAMWGANLVSNAGTLIQAVGAAWLMTGLTTSTTLVGLVQTASTLPTFLVGLLAGALADTMDRKRLLFWSQFWMLCVAFVLGVLTWYHLTTPWVLLGLTFLLGMGAAISLPTWQAMVQDIVPREVLPSAVSLNAIAFNLARSVGPAVGGFLVAVTSASVAFLINAASFIAVLLAVSTWKPAPLVRSPLRESVWTAIAAGFRYLLHSRRLQVPIIRAAVFNICAGVVWPLLAIFARDVLKTTADGYGLLLTAFGMGSIVSAVAVPRLRNMLSLDKIIAIGSLISAAAYVGLSFDRSFYLSLALLFFAGMAWVGVLINFNVAVQTAVPAWVRGRALSFYLLCFQGVLAFGGFFWGSLAGSIGVRECFQVAAAGLVIGLTTIRFFPLTPNEDMDLRTSTPNPDLHGTITMGPEDGPVLVVNEYLIAPEDVVPFRDAMRSLRELRLRDGARRWRLYSGGEEPEKFIEIFVLDSWGEHLRQHERITVSDRRILEHVRSYHRGPEPPKVRHYLRLES